MRFLHEFFLPSHVILGAVAVCRSAISAGTLYTAWSFVVWGMFVRLVYVLHVTWFVNSATHLWGYRNYETTDDSRNLWWVGLLAFGEGWHNNHHAYQRMARQGHKWWEIDVTYWSICLLEKVGLAWNVVQGSAQAHPARLAVGFAARTSTFRPYAAAALAQARAVSENLQLQGCWLLVHYPP